MFNALLSLFLALTCRKAMTCIPTENWGQIQLSPDTNRENGGESGASFDLMSLPKGKERGNSTFVSRPLVSIPIEAISSASATTKNDLSLMLRPLKAASSSKDGNLELISARFAVPNICVGYGQTEEAGKAVLQDLQSAIKSYQSKFVGDGKSESGLLRLASMATGEEHRDESVICVFDDVPFSSPSGKYKIIISNYHLVLEEKRKGSSGVTSLPLSDILQIYVCDVPSYFSKVGNNSTEEDDQYLTIVLRNPLKVRSNNFAHLVISCPAALVLDEAHPWECELKTQEEIDKHVKVAPGEEKLLTPTLSGRVSEILMRAIKAIAKVPAYGGLNKEYRSVLTQHRQSCMRALFHGSEGLLYVVNGGLLFLHRPAIRLPFSDISRIEVNESERSVATFQFSVYVTNAKNPHVFSGIDKEEKEGLMAFFAKTTKLVRLGADEDDEDEEDDDDDDDEEASSGEEDGDEEDDDDEEEAPRKRHRSSHASHRKKSRKSE